MQHIKTNKRGFGFWSLLTSLSIILFLLSAVRAQSTNQNYPTPITSNEISGTVRARDLGDARLTSYFYVFNGQQGDVFINVVTKNFDGDIDVFTADNLRPLTKIVVYSDSTDSETGRVIYLRQPQRLILRIEGRTPDDNPATYRIKFAGSFAPLTGVAETIESKPPEVKTDEQGEVRVNSVGTIIEVKPKPTPAVRETVAQRESEKPKRTEEPEQPKSEEKEIAKKEDPSERENRIEEQTEATKPRVVITDNLPVENKNQPPTENKTVVESETVEKPISEIEAEAETKPEVEESKAKKTPVKEVKPKKTKARETAKTETKAKSAPNKPEAVEASQLENIRLIILFKDGGKIETPMSDILKVGVDKGILTIIYKNGSIGRYSILEVSKMTIE